ncbi:MAG: GGDEF domain-containing protein [Acidobacteriia bacterium]|nr:GGDEF domain-containing protein [Terriglobia bacterium]
MISLKKNRGPSSEDARNTLLLVIETLLHAVEVHAIPGDPFDYEKFQADIRSLRKAFAQPSAEAMLVAAGSATKIIEEYNQQAARFLRMHAAEMRKAVVKLTDTLAAITGDQEGAISHLRDLEHRIEKAPSMEEVKIFGAQLSESLDRLRVDAVDRQQRMEQMLSELRQKVQASTWGESADGAAPDAGPSSPQPLRAKAEAAIDRVLQAGGSGYVAVFVVDRVQLINARFGYAVGDQILVLFQQHLRQDLKPGDHLFRWTGPVFLILMERATLPESVRARVNHLTSAKLESTVQLDSRSVLLPVRSTSAVFSLFEAPSTAALVQQIEAFIAGQMRS